MISNDNIIIAISNLKSNIEEMSKLFEEWVYTDNEWIEPSWGIEKCYFQILVIVEALQLSELHKIIYEEYKKFKINKNGFLSVSNYEGEIFSTCLSRLRLYQKTIQSFYPAETNTKVNKDFLNIIKDIHYVITDKVLYGGPPKNENDVHLRIEGILKCIYPDLKHKPTLTKAIKNFSPDTGIASIETLIEYKFIAKDKDVPIIADQILADTRGYVSKDWNKFIYVIYETSRFRSEKEWNQLFQQIGLADNTTAVVLSGEPIKNKSKAKKMIPSKPIPP